MADIAVEQNDASWPRTYRDDLRDFIGPNAESYLRSYDLKTKRGRAGFSWAAAFIPLPWLMYRKMYGAAGALLLGGLVISFLLPHMSAGAGIGAVFGVMGKQLYFSHADAKIKKISARQLPTEEHVAVISRAGGISWLGAALGSIITVAGVLAVLYTAHSPHA
ncbi:MAG TPA: hypothetical protein VN229_02155 [Terriglobales bacterium]|nr:hypothetical protein [Terriglobales bacterium]